LYISQRSSHSFTYAHSTPSTRIVKDNNVRNRRSEKRVSTQFGVKAQRHQNQFAHTKVNFRHFRPRRSTPSSVLIRSSILSLDIHNINAPPLLAVIGDSAGRIRVRLQCPVVVPDGMWLYGSHLQRGYTPLYTDDYCKLLHFSTLVGKS